MSLSFGYSVLLYDQLGLALIWYNTIWQFIFMYTRKLNQKIKKCRKETKINIWNCNKKRYTVKTHEVSLSPHNWQCNNVNKRYCNKDMMETKKTEIAVVDHPSKYIMHTSECDVQIWCPSVKMWTLRFCFCDGFSLSPSNLHDRFYDGHCTIPILQYFETLLLLCQVRGNNKCQITSRQVLCIY